MKGILSVSEILGIVVSCCYRVILATVCLFISFYKEAMVTTPILIFIIVVYFALFVFFKTNKRDKERTILDYVFIGISLLGRDVYSPEGMLLVLLPLFNAPNYTGRSLFPWPFLLSLLTFIIFDSDHRLFLPLIILTPLILLWYVFLFKKIFNVYVEETYSVIDKSFNKYFLSNRVHLMHKEMVEKLQKMPITSSCSVSDIYYLTIFGSNSKITPISGSRYVSYVSFHNKGKFLKKIDKDEIVENWELDINNKRERNSICIKSKYGKTEYLTLVILSEECQPLAKALLIKALQNRIVPKVIRLINTSSVYRQLQQRNIDKLKQNLQYIESTDAIIHFLNNKFSPISGFIQQYELTKKCPEELKEKNESLLEKYCERAKSSLELVVEKNNQLLSMQERVDYTHHEKISLEEVQTIIANYWGEQLDEEAIKAHWSNDELKKIILTSSDGLFIFASELIDNIKKHGSGSGSLWFLEKKNSFYACFQNDVTSNSEKIEKVVMFINEGQGYAQAERFMNGTKILMLLARQLKIKLKATFVENKVTYYVIFPYVLEDGKENENSSI